LESTDLEAVANVVVAALAGIAFATDLLRSGGGLHAGLDLRDARADGLDDGGKFVPLDDRIRRVGMLAVPDMDVGSANADFFDAEEDFARTRDGFRGFF